MSELDPQPSIWRRVQRPSHVEWREVRRRFVRFVQLSLRKAIADALPTQSAALAFLTMLSLVPLLAALSHFSAGFFSASQVELVELLSRVLPYTEVRITQTLAEFLDQTQQLRGFGLMAFILTALATFSAVEQIINNIWHIPRRRPLRSRLNSFVLLLFCGPVLIGAAYSMGWLSDLPLIGQLTTWMPRQYLPFSATCLGLSLLYWQVPFTQVRFKSALAGGLIAALLLEALRGIFSVYVSQVHQISLIYGSFGLALLFMISIQLAWSIVLLGSEFSYCVQNFAFLSGRRRSAATLEGSWLGLVSMTLIVDRFRCKEPLTPAELLAESLKVAVPELRRALQPLLDGAYLRENLDGSDGYLLTCDPYQLPVREILELYESGQWKILHDLPAGPAAQLEDCRERLRAASAAVLSDLKLADLLAEPSSSAEANVPVGPAAENKSSHAEQSEPSV